MLYAIEFLKVGYPNINRYHKLERMQHAGLIYDDSRHYLDHLAPLCALLNWPLIICEPILADLARTYYPDLEVIETSLWDLKLPPLIVTCDNIPLIRAAFPHQHPKTLWLPHGNSDKGIEGAFFEGIGETALVYGQKMIDFMHAKNAHPRTFRIGNFRQYYYLKHRDFYEKMISVPSAPNILYAPTWEDSENNGSFWTAFPHLASRIPHDHHLLVKLHPNTIRKFELELLTLSLPRNITILPDVPPIYPILNHCIAYIGDMSSIGYDFLSLDKPLYFINAKPHLPLHQCGTPICPSTFALSPDTHASIRKATYAYTFDATPNWDELRRSLQ